MNSQTPTHSEIPSDVMFEAEELARGATIHPGDTKHHKNGVRQLALKIMQARKEKRPLRIKLGVDPTGSQLHLGHTVVFRRLRRFQDFGHQAVIIIGGATATVGDPSGRDTTRPTLTADQVRENATTFLDQIRPIVDLTKAEVVNNADWIQEELCKNILTIGTKVSLAELSARFKDRLADGNSPSVTEALYQLLQGWDSVHVEADLEIGGEDQLSNLHMGRKLQQNQGREPQMVLMLPLLVGTDGVKKMSKSFGNAIALNDSPDDIFGKCMRIPDEHVMTFFEFATFSSQTLIEAARQFLAENGNPRDLKERLAVKIITELHDVNAAAKAVETWNRLHKQSKNPTEMPLHVMAAPTALVDLLVATKLAASKSRARDLIAGGGVRLDGLKISDQKLVVEFKDQKSVVLSVGNRADKFVRLVEEV